MKKQDKKLILLLSILTISLASIFSSIGQESRPFKYRIYGTISDTEPEINIKYDSYFLKNNQVIDVFDLGNIHKQYSNRFSLIIGSYDINKPRILECKISTSPFILYNDDNTSIKFKGDCPNIQLIQGSNHLITHKTPYLSSCKTFSLIIPPGYHNKKEYPFVDFTFDITPGNKKYIPGNYISTVTFNFSII